METFSKENTINLFYTPEGATKEVVEPYELRSFTFYLDHNTGVALIELGLGEKMSPFRHNQRWEYSLLLKHLERDQRVKVVIFTGNGRAFSAGADFSEPRPYVCYVPEHVKEAYTRENKGVRMEDVVIKDLMLNWMDFPKPAICAVNGMAVGIAANMALFAYDVVFAAEGSKYLLPFVNIGIVPEAGSSYSLTQIVGPMRAKRIFFDGDWISADELQRMGLVNEIVPAAQLRAEAIKYAEKLAKKSQTSLRYIKKLVNSTYREQVSKQLDDELVYFSKSMESEEHRKAMKDFMQKHGGKGKKNKNRSKL